MPDEQPNEITFVYEETDEVRTIAATGAHGGPTPTGPLSWPICTSNGPAFLTT